MKAAQGPRNQPCGVGLSDLKGAYGANIGRKNREAVRQFFASHIGCSAVECSAALGLSVAALSRHVTALRNEWLTDLSTSTSNPTKLRAEEN